MLRFVIKQVYILLSVIANNLVQTVKNYIGRLQRMEWSQPSLTDSHLNSNGKDINFFLFKHNYFTFLVWFYGVIITTQCYIKTTSHSVD